VQKERGIQAVSNNIKDKSAQGGDSRKQAGLNRVDQAEKLVKYEDYACWFKR